MTILVALAEGRVVAYEDIIALSVQPRTIASYPKGQPVLVHASGVVRIDPHEWERALVKK